MSKVALMMAAGTGGHVFPALAVAKQLVEEGYEVHWLGTPTGMENRLVPMNGFPLHAVNIKGLRGKGFAGILAAPWLIAKAVWQSLKIIRQIKTNVVIGFGGYIAGPGGVAARLAGLPLIIHEQNALSGLTNRMLNRISHTSLQAFPGTLPGAVTVGNPVRADLVCSDFDLKVNPDRLRVLVIGGSLGAKALNDAVLACWQLLEEDKRPELRHQVGQKDSERMLAAYQNTDVKAEVTAFIDDMAAAYQWADLMICRAGASTVSEVAAAGKPAIFVPFPFAVDDHQTVNAGYLVGAGGALLKQQSELTPEWLAEQISNLDSDRGRLEQMARINRNKALPDATEHAVKEIERTIHDHQS
ncbi:MAG: undecaprenyldiphospho-muramoylpentapeptide beta-N-acetylglucosaminyltransferase [Oceanobacter sp.]